MGHANEIEYDIRTTLDDCIERLKGLLDGLESREVLLRHRSDAVDLHPTPLVYLTVKAKQKGSIESLAIEVGWKAQPSVPPSNDGLHTPEA